MKCKLDLVIFGPEYDSFRSELESCSQFLHDVQNMKFEFIGILDGYTHDEGDDGSYTFLPERPAIVQEKALTALKQLFEGLLLLILSKSSTK